MNLDMPEGAPKPLLTLDSQDNPTVSETTASLRAAKAAYGMTGIAGVDLPYDKLHQAISTGKEKDVRQEAATAIDANAGATMAKRLAQLNTPTTEALATLQRLQPTDPDTVFEYNFAKRFVSTMYSLSKKNDEDPEYNYPQWMKDAQVEIPEHVDETLGIGSSLGAIGEYTLKKYQDIRDKYEDQSYFGRAVDIGKGLFPGYDEAKLRGRTPHTGFFTGGLRGENLKQQALDLLLNYGTNVEGYKKALDAAVDQLAKDNPALALDYMKAITDWSTNERYLNNFLTVFDVATTAAGFKGGPALARQLFLKNQINQATKTVLQALPKTTEKPIKQVAASAAGDIGEAAVQKSVADTIAPHPNEAIERFTDTLRVDTQYLRDTPTNDGQELANRIADNREGFIRNILGTTAAAIKGDRLLGIMSSEALQRELRERIKTLYPGWGNQIMNMSDPYMEALTPNWISDVSFMNHNGELWEDIGKAKEAAYAGGFQGAKPDNQGKGVFFTIKHYWDENDPIFKRYRTELPGNETPLSNHNALLTRIRTPEDTLSVEQNMLRKAATYAPSIIFKLVKEHGDRIAKIAPRLWKGPKSKELWKEYEDTLKFAKTAHDPTIPKAEQGPHNIGYFYRSIGELQQHYMQHYQRLAKPWEVEAYFAHRDINDIDWILRNNREYTNAARLGAKQYRIRTFPEGVSPLATEHEYSPWINAVQRSEYPHGDGGFLVDRGQLGSEKVYQAVGNVSKKIENEIKTKLANGKGRLIELHHPEHHPLHGFGSKIEANNWIRWVYSENLESKDLDPIQIPRRGGGHVDYDFSHSIKQADVRWSGETGKSKAIYHGDSTAFLAPNRVMGGDVVKTLNKVREMMFKDKDLVSAKAHFDQNFTAGLEFKDFASWFKPRKVTKNGKKVHVSARFSEKEPFHLVARDKMIIDMDNELQKRYVTSTGKDAFLDGTRKASIGRQMQVEFSGQRDAWDVFSMENQGTVQNPMYRFIPAPTVSPTETLNRAMNKIIHSTWMDDYKIAAIESWVQEASKLQILDATQREVDGSPFGVFHDVNLKKGYKRSADKTIVHQFEANRLKIQQFVGVQDWTNAMLHDMAQNMADSIYEKTGQKGLDLIPTWMLARSTDPVRTLRSITFNAKMGLFSPGQFFLHAATFANVAGIAGPVRASQGALGAFLHLMTTFNRKPEFLDLLDKIASKMRIYKPGEWKEAYHMLEHNGFLNEAGTYAMKDTAYSHKVIQHGLDTFLDWGQIPFRAGLRSLRAASWYTSYKEMRVAKGATHSFGNRESIELLHRADLFSHNMSRASNSLLHTGLMSLPAQFQTYFLRLGEMMFGKRLSWKEKARMLAINSTLFGIPTAAGLWMYPFGDHIRDTARESGYVIGDNFINDTLMNGLPSMLSQVAMGIPLSFGESYGPRGMQNLDDIIQGDPTFWKILGGATLTTFGNTLANFTRFTKQMYAGITMDPAVYKPDAGMVMDLVSELSGLNRFNKAWLAVYTGNWYSNKGTLVGKATATEAWVRAFTGLQDQNKADLYRMGLTIQRRRALERDGENMFQRDATRAMQAQKDNNPEQAQNLFSRAFHVLDLFGFPPQRKARAVQRFWQNNQSLIESTYKQYYIGPNAPPGGEDAYVKQLQQGTIGK